MKTCLVDMQLTNVQAFNGVGAAYFFLYIFSSIFAVTVLKHK